MRRSPFLVDHLLAQGAEFVGHGVSSEQTISEAMAEDVERAQIAASFSAIEETTGKAPRGWLGSDYAESSRTVALLAEQGFDYVLDWPTDEQPHPMKVPTGTMTNLPVMIELDDVLTHHGRSIRIERFCQAICEQFDRMWKDGEKGGRVFVLNVHPWVMGHPFRVKYFAQAIDVIASRPGVYVGTAGQIVDAYRMQNQASDH